MALHPPGYPGAGGGGGCWWVGLGRDAARDGGVAGGHCGGVEGPRVRVRVRFRVRGATKKNIVFIPMNQGVRVKPCMNSKLNQFPPKLLCMCVWVGISNKMPSLWDVACLWRLLNVFLLARSQIPM